MVLFCRVQYFLQQMIVTKTCQKTIKFSNTRLVHNGKQIHIEVVAAFLMILGALTNNNDLVHYQCEDLRGSLNGYVGLRFMLTSEPRMVNICGARYPTLSTCFLFGVWSWNLTKPHY